MALGINNLESIHMPKSKYLDDEGVEKEVNLEIVSSSSSLYEFENTSNNIKTFFKKNICDYSPVKIVLGNSYFEWTPFGVGFSDEYGNEDWFGRVNSVDAEIIEENKVIYKNLVNDIDDEFIVNVGELKHNTILNSKPIYKNTLPGKHLSIVVDGKIDFSDGICMCVDGVEQKNEFETSSKIEFKDLHGETVFALPSPVAYEISSGEQIQCIYKVSKSGNIITLKILTPYSWLEDAKRIYPIAIDPTLIHINSSGMPTVIQSSAWSADGEHFAIGYNYQAKVYKFNKLNNQIIELPTPTGGYPVRSEKVFFTPDGKFLLRTTNSSAGTLGVYAFDSTTGGFTTLIDEITTSYSTVAFFHNLNRILYVNRYSLFFQDFDYQTGKFLGNPNSVGLPYIAQKIQITNNDKIILRLESSGDRFRANWYTNGTLGSAISLPTGAISSQITGFCLSPDNKYIAFTTNTPSNLFVCPFDQDTGIIGNPVYPNAFLDVSGVEISFSKKMDFIIVAQYTSNPPSGNAIKIYRFNKKNGTIGDIINLEPSLPQPKMENGRPVTSITFSPDGTHLLLTRSASTSEQSLFLYKFFYEPEDNVFFKDPITKDYYSDNKGNTLMLIDFGTIIAGQTTAAKEILIENKYNFAVKNVQLSIDNSSQQFKVEMSKTETPFIPETSLLLNHTLSPDETLPFYVRLTSTDQSQSGGMFDIRLRCDKA